jgi:hypothetical protein
MECPQEQDREWWPHELAARDTEPEKEAPWISTPYPPEGWEHHDIGGEG